MSRFADGQVGLIVGLNVGEFADFEAGLSLLRRGNKGQVGGLVGSSETIGIRGGPGISLVVAPAVGIMVGSPVDDSEGENDSVGVPVFMVG